MDPLLLFVPGAPELLVIILIAVIVFGVPLVIAGGLVLLYRNRNRVTEERLQELEEQVAELSEDTHSEASTTESAADRGQSPQGARSDSTDG